LGHVFVSRNKRKSVLIGFLFVPLGPARTPPQWSCLKMLLSRLDILAGDHDMQS
jgi:hypothetical protein